MPLDRRASSSMSNSRARYALSTQRRVRPPKSGSQLFLRHARGRARAAAAAAVPPLPPAADAGPFRCVSLAFRRASTCCRATLRGTIVRSAYRTGRVRAAENPTPFRASAPYARSTRARARARVNEFGYTPVPLYRDVLLSPFSSPTLPRVGDI